MVVKLLFIVYKLKKVREKWTIYPWNMKQQNTQTIYTIPVSFVITIFIQQVIGGMAIYWPVCYVVYTIQTNDIQTII
jgi:hypothetical protein